MRGVGDVRGVTSDSCCPHWDLKLEEYRVEVEWRVEAEYKVEVQPACPSQPAHSQHSQPRQLARTREAASQLAQAAAPTASL